MLFKTDRGRLANTGFWCTIKPKTVIPVYIDRIKRINVKYCGYFPMGIPPKYWGRVPISLSNTWRPFQRGLHKLLSKVHGPCVGSGGHPVTSRPVPGPARLKCINSRHDTASSNRESAYLTAQTPVITASHNDTYMWTAICWNCYLDLDLWP